MKGLRIIAALLCAVMLAVPAMADDFDMGDFDAGSITPPATSSDPSLGSETPDEPEPIPEQQTVRDDTGNTESAAHDWDDNIWNWSASGTPNLEPSSEKQQELEQARREWEEKQNQRDEAFREAEQENAALPEEEEEPKKSAGGKAEETAPTELVLPKRQGKTVSPVRYILIGALLAAALCIAIYLFTHPAREEDPEQEQK